MNESWISSLAFPLKLRCTNKYDLPNMSLLICLHNNIVAYKQTLIQLNEVKTIIHI